MEWQPIKTAPKDGRHIICLFPKFGARNISYCEQCYWDGENFAWSQDHDVSVIPPTHWMPLPEPPVTE